MRDAPDRQRRFMPLEAPIKHLRLITRVSAVFMQIINDRFPVQKMARQTDDAERIGLEAVAWLAGNDELLPVFLGATGASEDSFRAGLTDPVFQASVLDFLLMDDAWIVAFCDAAGLEYGAPGAARAQLAGGDVHWT